MNQRCNISSGRPENGVFDESNEDSNVHCTENIRVQEILGRDHCGIGRGGGNPPIEQVRAEQMNFTYDLDGEVKGTTEGNFEDAILYGHDQIDMSTNESTAVYGAVHDLK